MGQTKTEDRVQRLLDQLENPNLSDKEIEKIKRKLEILQSQGTQGQ